jgi:hypothetical protein
VQGKADELADGEIPIPSLREIERKSDVMTGLRETRDFRPHVGIAYGNNEGSPGELVERVRRLRGLPPAKLTWTR